MSATSCRLKRHEDTNVSTFRDFDDISHSRYRVILADPAWSFLTRSPSGQGRSPSQHYDCMSIADIAAMPVRRLMARGGGILFLWVPDPHLVLGLQVMKDWGFEYKTVGFTWVKRNKNSKPLNIQYDRCYVPAWGDHQFFTGMGYYTRANPEMCLIGTSATRMPHRKHMDVRQLIVAKRREHSRKPDETYERIERLFDGPYLEMFARTARPGWDSWGNEVEKFVNQVDATG
jgi:N6-adenosine-specific RNA methylase IME4